MKAPRPWGSEDDINLVRMRSVEHKTWVEIGATLGRSKTACHFRYTAIVPREEQVKLAAKRMWTVEDEATLQHLRYVEKKSCQEISVIVGMTIGQVASKLERMRVPSKRLHFEKETVSFKVPQRCIDDRNQRYAASPRDLTGAFFGDPPKGFSALERRV